MVNNIIVVLSLLLTSTFYLKQRYQAAFLTVISLAMLAPTLQINGSYLNAAYLMTVWLFATIVIESIRDKRLPKLEKTESRILLWVFIVSRVWSIGAYVIGYVQNGTAGISAFMGALLGNINLFVLVVLLVYMGLKMPKKRLLPVFFQSAVLLAAVNVVFYVLQRFFFEIGYDLTYSLFMSPDRSFPLETMKAIGAFDRIFGSFFTPTVLGTTFLYMIVILLAWYFVTQKELLLPMFATIIVLTYVGITSFSKLIILGLPAMIVYLFVCLLIMKRSKTLKPIKLNNFWVMTSLLVAVFVVAYLTFPQELINVKNYYYGMLMKPLNSLTSRYKIPTNINPDIIEAGEPLPDAGKTVDALNFFRQHPIFGVGPIAVADEFIGDSQVSMVLHHGGIVGAVGYLLFYGYAFIKGIQKQNLMVISLIAALFIGCLASNTLDYRHTMPFIAFIILAVRGADHEFGPDSETHKLGWLGQEIALTDQHSVSKNMS